MPPKAAKPKADVPTAKPIAVEPEILPAVEEPEPEPEPEPAERLLPPGIIRTGVVTGPLAQRASISPVRQYNSWHFTIVDETSAAQLTVSRMRCFNVPTWASDAYLKLRLLNDGCKQSRDETRSKTNASNPRFSEEVLHLPLPAGMTPTVQVELWGQDAEGADSLIAYARMLLEDTPTPRYVERTRLNLKAGVATSVRGALSCSFEYRLEPLEGYAAHAVLGVAAHETERFFSVLLEATQPGVSERVVWLESVMRELAKANDRDKGVGALKPIHEAAAAGSTERVAELLGRSVSLEAKAKHMWTPLVFAIRQGHLEAVRQLLDAGADVHVGDYRNSLPLHRAAYGSAQPQNDADIIRALVGRKAGINAKDRSGRTPLHVAADIGNLAAARALIEQGADHWAKDNDLRSPADLAREAGAHGHHEAPAIIELFEQTKPTPWRQHGGGAVRAVPRYELDAMHAERAVRAAMRPPARGGP